MIRFLRPLLIVFAILIADQVLKSWVKANLFLGEEIPLLGNKFMLHHTENNGMAFGFELGGSYGKLLLTSFRLLAVTGIAYLIIRYIRKRQHQGLITCLTLIFAGALGNIIDSVFYGVIYGYADFFHGRVVDMLYAPLFEGILPQWFPIWGGQYFLFFEPVFNIADAAITLGVITLLLFQKRFLTPAIIPIQPSNDEVEEE